MIQRDHVTSSHEFRAIRFQLTSMLEKSGSPKEVLKQLKSNRGNGEEMKTLSRNIQNIKNTMEGHAHAHAGIKGSIKEHIENVDKIAEKSAGGGMSWTVLILFQV